MARRSRAAKVTLIAGGGLLLALAALGGAVVMRPLWFYVTLGRIDLRAAGLEKARIEGPRGPLVYFRGGVGPPVVLLHGANDQAGTWARVAAPLARGFRLLVLDLPGHGESAPASGSLSVEDSLDALDAVFGAEPLEERATLVGNALGGFVAMDYAALHPDRVAHVILVNASPLRSESPGSGANFLPNNREQARQGVEALVDSGAPSLPDFVLDDLVRRSPGSPLERLLQSNFSDYALDGQLRDFPTPVTLLWGESNRLMPPAHAESLRKQLPAARLQIIPRCGQVPQLECPERFLPLLDHALSDPPAPSDAEADPAGN